MQRRFVAGAFGSFALLSLLALACNNPNTTTGGGTPTPSGTGPTPTPTGTPLANMCTSAGGSVTASGGTLDCLNFFIVGDTRPATSDDTSGPPYTTIQHGIYQDIAGLSPLPSFGIATGDYEEASNSSASSTQLGMYLQQASQFSGTVFYTMGNHECNGNTTSNCTDGSGNFSTYQSMMLQPLGESLPYYVKNVSATDGSWTAKFVFIAANYWDTTQANWLSNALSQSTTYTFIMRHEKSTDGGTGGAPGVDPSQAIISQYPNTQLIEGHTHTMQWYSGLKEFVVGNGGAPLYTSVNYGYSVARQRKDGAMNFTAYDYQTKAMQTSFFVTAAGNPTL